MLSKASEAIDLLSNPRTRIAYSVRCGSLDFQPPVLILFVCLAQTSALLIIRAFSEGIFYS